MSITIHNVQRPGKRCTSIIIPTEKEPTTMKASEARTLMLSKKPKVSDIYVKIRAAASQGKGVIHHNLTTEIDKKFVKETIAELEAAGYEVQRQCGESQRDNESWDYLVITW